MRRLIYAVDHAIFAPLPAAPLGAARALLGLSCLLAWSFTLPRLGALYGPGGAAAFFGSPRGAHWTEGALLPLEVGLLVGSLGLMLGAWTRTSALLLAACHTALIGRLDTWTWGWGTTTPLFVLLVAFGGGGAAASVDAWRAGGRRPGAAVGPAEISGWGPRLLWVHMGCIYLAAAWHRVDDEAWLTGHILWEALTSGVFSRWVALDFTSVAGPLRFLAYFAWGLELAAPLLLLLRPTRALTAALCIGLHAGLEISTTVGWWQFIMGSCLCAALPAELWRPVLHRLLGPRG